MIIVVLVFRKDVLRLICGYALLCGRSMEVSYDELIGERIYIVRMS